MPEETKTARLAAMKVALESDNPTVKAALDQLLVATHLAHEKEEIDAKKPKHLVNLIESERGWGQKVDETRTFETMEEALSFVAEFNKKNNLPHVPDWYMFAEYVGIREV